LKSRITRLLPMEQVWTTIAQVSVEINFFS
jgi:hypothetical protein